MILCTCEKCRYIFSFPYLPEDCPDCGKKSVRNAHNKEIKEYWRFRKIIEDEIRLGVIPG